MDTAAPNPNDIRLRAVFYAADTCINECPPDVDYIVIACSAFTRFRINDVHLDGATATRWQVYERWLREKEHVAVFGSADPNNRSCPDVLRVPAPKFLTMRDTGALWRRH